MRSFKTLFVILVVSCLALSSLMASPSTWAWLHPSQPSDSSEVLPETSVEEPAELTKDSKVSKATSKSKSETVEYVMIPKTEFEKYTGMIAEGNESNKKGGTKVNEGTEGLVASSKAYKEETFRTMFGVAGDYGIQTGLKLGLELGFIFKDTLYARGGVMKNNLKVWDDCLKAEGYTMTFGIGWIF